MVRPWFLEQAQRFRASEPTVFTLRRPQWAINRPRKVTFGRGPEVLVLYRKRTGAMLLRNGVYSHAGSLLIQRLEGSLCGIFELWVLNCAKRGESWRAGWWIVIGWLNWPPGPVFPEIYSRTPGNAGTRVAMVLEPVLRS